MSSDMVHAMLAAKHSLTQAAKPMLEKALFPLVNKLSPLHSCSPSRQSEDVDQVTIWPEAPPVALFEPGVPQHAVGKQLQHVVVTQPALQHRSLSVLCYDAPVTVAAAALQVEASSAKATCLLQLPLLGAPSRNKGCTHKRPELTRAKTDLQHGEQAHGVVLRLVLYDCKRLWVAVSSSSPEGEDLVPQLHVQSRSVRTQRGFMQGTATLQRKTKSRED